MLGMSDVGDLRGNDFGFGRAGVIQKLIDLMRADVAKDSAVKVRVPEPLGTSGATTCIAVPLNYLVWSDVDGLNYATDRAGLNQISCFDSGFYFEPLAVHDAVDAMSFRNGLAHFGELLQCGDAGLVA